MRLRNIFWAILLVTTACKTIVDGRVIQSCVVSTRAAAPSVALNESDCRDPRAYALDVTVFSESLESPEKVTEKTEICLPFFEQKECWDADKHLFSTREAVQASPDKAGAKEYNYEEYRVVLLNHRSTPVRTFASDASFEKALAAAVEYCGNKTREESP